MQHKVKNPSHSKKIWQRSSQKMVSFVDTHHFVSIIFLSLTLILISFFSHILSRESEITYTEPNEPKTFTISQLPEIEIDTQAVPSDSLVSTLLNTPVDPKTITTQIENNNGQQIDVEIEITPLPNNHIALKILQTELLKPGKYTITASWEEIGRKVNYKQDFYWGVLAINPNKSIYLPQETALIDMAVLDEEGQMVCDAEVNLKITTPTHETIILTTTESTIQVNSECLSKNFTLNPDYETSLIVYDIGTYTLDLTATTPNGSYSISDQFEVRDSVPFEVERIANTRIYPVEIYPVTIKIKANEDFTGQIIEKVPTSFTLLNLDQNASIVEKDDFIEIIWSVALHQNDSLELHYSYDAPDENPQFYLLGPLAFTDISDSIQFEEIRQWQIAVDAYYYLPGDYLIDDTAQDVTAQFSPSPTIVFVSHDTGYIFYADATGTGDLVYKKTTDGGVTWSDTTTMSTVTNFINASVWYDQWTPGDTGTKIYIVAQDVTQDALFFHYLDTNGDNLRSGGLVTVVDTASIAASATGAPTITKSTEGNLFANVQSLNTGSGEGGLVYKSTGVSDWGSWSDVTPSGWSDDDLDQIQMIPLYTDNDILAIRHDASASNVEYQIYDEVGNNWTGSWTYLTTATDNATYDQQYSATGNRSTGDVYLVVQNEVASATGDMEFWNFSDSTRGWTQGANIETNNSLVASPQIIRDIGTDGLYVAYTNADSAIQTNSDIIVRKSKDYGASWTDQSRDLTNQADDVRTIRCNYDNESKFYCAFYNDDLNQIWGVVVPYNLQEEAISIDDTTRDVTTEYTPGSTVVFTDDLTGYVFYVDGTGNDLVYKKTADGGVTWGDAQLINTAYVFTSVTVWYDQWTPGDTTGTKIYIIANENNPDESWFTYLDTNGDNLRVGGLVQMGNSSAFQAGSDGNATITKGGSGNLFATFHAENSGTFKGQVFKSTDGGDSWSDITPDGWTVLDDDQSLLLPLKTNDDIIFLLADYTNNQIESRVYSETSDTWVGSWNTIGTLTLNATYDNKWSATVRKSTGDIYLAFANNANNAANDLEFHTFSDSTRSWTTRTNIVSDSLSLHSVAPVVDENTGDIYAIYVRSPNGQNASTAVKVYYKKSDDNGDTWESEVGPFNNLLDDLKYVRSHMQATTRIYAVWGNDDLNTLTGSTIVRFQTLSQSSYRFFENTNSTDVGSVMANQDTATSLSSDGQQFRLRMLIHLDGSRWSYRQTPRFSLQYAEKSGTCDTSFSGETYQDVGSNTAIAFYNNATPIDDAALTGNANDPVHNGHTTHDQNYKEYKYFSNLENENMDDGEDAMWDFSLYDNSAPENTGYCFRIVYAGSDIELDSYAVIPEINTYSASGIDISGRIYTDDGSIGLDCTTTRTVNLRINGSGSYTTECSNSPSNGSFAFTSIPANNTDIITLYIDNEDEEATTVLVSNSINQTNVNLYENQVIVRDDVDGIIIPDNLYAGDDTDDDIKYIVSAATNGNTTIDSGFEFHVWTEDTFDTDGGTIATQGAGGNIHVDDNAILEIDTGTNTIAGDLLVDGGATARINANTTISGGDIITSGTNATVTTTSGTPTVTISGSSTTSVGGGTTPTLTFYNLTKTSGGSTTTFTSPGTVNNDLTLTGGGNLTLSAAMTVTGDISVADGSTLTVNADLSIDGGALTTAGVGGVVTYTSGTPTVDIDGTGNLGGGTGTVKFYNLDVGDETTDTTTLASTITIDNSLTVNTSQTLAMGTRSVTVGNTSISGSGEVVINGVTSQSASGNFTILSNTSDAQLSGSGELDVYNFTVGNSSATVSVDNETSDLSLDIANDFTITTSATFKASSTAGLTVAGSYSNSGTFTANEGTLTLDTSGGELIEGTMTGTSSFYNLTFNNASGTWQFGASATILKNFTITEAATQSIYAPSSTLTVGGNFTHTTEDSFVHNNGSVIFNGASGTTQQVTGTTTFYNLTATATAIRTIEFGASTTFTIGNNLTLTGTSCTAYLSLRSTSTDTQWNLDDNTGGTTNVNYVDVKDSNATDQSVTVSTGINSGNNTSWSFTSFCASTSTSVTATGNSFQRKTFYDDQNETDWRFFYDGNEIDIEYSQNNGDTWTSTTSLAYDTNDFSIWWKAITVGETTTEYAWLAVATSNDILVRRGTLSATSIAWDSEANVVALNGSGASDTYLYPFISLDSCNYMWVGGRYYDGTNYVYHAVRSDVDDTGNATWSGVGFGTTITVSQISDDQTNENVFGNIVPLADQDMYATFVSNTALEGCVWDHSDTRWENSAGSVCAVVSASTPAFRSYANLEGGFGTSAAISKPTGTVDNDIMIATIYRETSTTLSVPTGWQLIDEELPALDHDVNIYWKRASSEGTSYTWSWSGSTWRLGAILTYSGAITTGSPIDTYSANSATSGTTMTATSINTSVDNTTIVAIATHWLANEGNWTGPSGYTARIDMGFLRPADKTQSSAGATGDATITTSDGSDSWTAHLVALLPPSAGGNQDAIDTVPTGTSHNMSAVVDTTNFDVHLVYIDDETTDQISYKRWDNGTTSWDSSPVVIDNTDHMSYTTLSIDTATGDLYALWIDAVGDGFLHYRQCDVTTDTADCSTGSFWQTKVDWKDTTTTQSVTSNYSGNNRIFGLWTQNTSSPYTIEWALIIPSVGNNTPTVTSVVLNSGNNIDLTENTTVSISWTATVTDLDGNTDIASATGKTYRSGIGGAEACTNNNNNCYEDVSCSLSSCSGNSCTATCTIDMYFHADSTNSTSPQPTEYWRAWVEATDTQSVTGEGWSGVGSPDVNSLFALNVDSTITYGPLLPGDNSESTPENTTVTNTGNRAIDAEVSGDLMCTDYPTCSGHQIGVENQEYSMNTFTWGSGTDLSYTETSVQINLTKPTTSPSTSTTIIYWGIGIPDPQGYGSYSGQNTVSAISDT